VSRDLSFIGQALMQRCETGTEEPRLQGYFFFGGGIIFDTFIADA